MNCGECKPLGSSWLDPKSCITYQCEYDPLLKDLFIVEKQLGKINMNTNASDKFILVIYIYIYNLVIYIYMQLCNTYIQLRNTYIQLRNTYFQRGNTYIQRGNTYIQLENKYVRIGKT